MATTPNVGSWSSMTATINEIKSPNNFVWNMLYAGTEDPQFTDTIELSFWRRGRKIAPFVRKNGSAIMTDTHAESFAQVEPPNIRIKRPMEASALINQRRAGSVIFPTSGQQSSAMQTQMARELQNMADDIANSEEYLACLSLQGEISYEVADGEVFTITFPRSAGNDVTLSGADLWDAGGTEDIEGDFQDAAEAINDGVSLGCTDAICGALAADQFRTNAIVRATLDNRNIDAGTLLLRERFRQSGALFLGSFYNGINVWRYARTVDVNGSTVDLIRSKYVEFIAATREAQFTAYYGPIADMKALGSRQFVGKRFSKSWEVEDPSVRWVLAHTRPLPVPRRPDATYSLKVLA